jgi:hypothetical protein
MKTTLEIPDAVFRRAKSKAAAQGMPLRQFVTEAVEEKLKSDALQEEKPWLKHMGKLKHLRKETARINRLIEEESEKIDPEMSYWPEV